MHRGRVFDGVRRQLADEASERWRHRHRTPTPIYISGHDPDGDDYPLRLRAGDFVQPGQLRSRELPGGLRKSAHRGRVLRVS
jgi:hypothetical protein